MQTMQKCLNLSGHIVEPVAGVYQIACVANLKFGCNSDFQQVGAEDGDIGSPEHVTDC